MKKLIFFSLFLLLLGTSTLIQNAVASEWSTYITKETNLEFTFTNTTVDYTDYNANHVATHNWEFPNGTVITDLYPNRFERPWSVATVVDCEDKGYYLDTTMYQSKKLEVVKDNPTVGSFAIYHQNFTEPVALKKIKRSCMIEHDAGHNLDYVFFFFTNDTSDSAIYTRLTVNSKIVDLYVYGVLVETSGVLLPAENTYTYLILSCYYYNGYLLYSYYCMNASFGFVDAGSYNFDISDYLDTMIYSVRNEYLNYNADGTKFWIYYEDYNYNFRLDRNETIPISESDYLFVQDRSYYLTEYENNIALFNQSSGCESFDGYAECIHYYDTLGNWSRPTRRYVNVNSQSLHIINNSDIFTTVFNNNSKTDFSMKFSIEVEQNASILYLMFTNYYIQCYTSKVLNYSYFRFRIYYYNNSIYKQYDFYSDTQNSLSNIIYLQYQNDILTISVSVSNRIYTYLIPNLIDFQFASALNYRILLSECKTILNEHVNFKNGTFSILNDFIAFNNLTFMLESINYYTEIIEIDPISVVDSIIVNDETLYLSSVEILTMYITATRNYNTVNFNMNSENQIGLEYLFDSESYVYTSQTSILNGQNGGNFSISCSIIENTIELSLEIKSIFLISYLSSLISDNYLTLLITDIMIPIILIGVFTYAFSQSEHRVMSAFGLYVSLAILYLIGYLDVLFLMLSVILATIILYFIIKRERSEI